MSTEAQKEIGELLAQQPRTWDELIAQRDDAFARLDQAQRFAVAFSSECAHLEAERDDLILRLERARAELSQVKDAAGEDQ